MADNAAIWTDNEVQAQITFELEQHVQDWLGAGARLNKEPDQHQFRHSFFLNYQADSVDGPVTILVKIARKPSIRQINDAIKVDELRNIAQKEYSFLKMTWDAFERAKKTDFYTVQPFAYLDEWNAIVMRKADGQSLNRLFYKPAIPLGLAEPRQKLLAVLNQAGQWLKLFHCYAGEMQLEPFPRDASEKDIDELLESLSVNSTHQIDIQGLKKGLRASLSKLNGEVPIARLHGDYHFSNILFTPDGRVCALDSYYWVRGPVYEDLASLLVHPETRPAQVLSGGRFASPQLVSDCRKAVLDGYFESGSFDPNMLDFYCALHLLHQWSMNEKKLQNAGKKRVLLKPAVMVMRRYFERLLKQYIPATV
jgi:hypothetical protein